MAAAAAAASAAMLTAAAVSAHNALSAGMAASVTGLSATLQGALLDSSDDRCASPAAARDDDTASSILSSVPSSGLSELSSEEDASPRRPVKRLRKNMFTPPTSVDEPSSKRSHGRKLIKDGPTEYDVQDRKEYLEAGLYSGATNSLGKTSGRGKMQRKTTIRKSTGRLSRPLEEVIEEFQFGLPIFHGLALVQKEREFRLPWDIRNDFDLSCLPETAEGLRFRSEAWDRVGRQKKPASYKHITQNRLTWRQKDEADPVAVCGCDVGQCGDHCLNRVMQFFCSARFCKSGKQCTNLPFSTIRTEHDLEVFWTGNRGFGLRTNAPIEAGDFVMQYVGEIITINESYRRTLEEYKDRQDYYFLDYYDAEVVDAGLMGNESRFVNHSCDPNLEVVRWKLADYDEYQIGLFALRDIDAKEELCYDYGWQAFASIDTKADAAEGEKPDNEAPKQRCLCAGPSCTGFFEKSEKVKEKKAALLGRNQKKVKRKIVKGSDASKAKHQRT